MQSEFITRLKLLDVQAAIKANTTGVTPDGRRRITAGKLYQAIAAMDAKSDNATESHKNYQK